MSVGRSSTHPVQLTAGFAVAVAVALLLLFASCAGPSPQPTVILITVDTLRTDALNYSGSDSPESAARTPTIAALAATGTRFDQAIAPVPRTTPALASMLTGLYPHRHGSREVGDPMSDGTSIAQLLRAKGYQTLAVSANLSAGPKQKLDQGFDTFVDSEELQTRYGDQLHRQHEQSQSDQVGWAKATTDIAVQLLSETRSDRPLFLWVHYFDPHFVYRPPIEWQQGLDVGTCLQMSNRVLSGEITCGEVTDDFFGEASLALQGCRRLYQAEVNYTDAQIGRLLEQLEAIGRRDGALIAFTADHGENLGEDGLYYEHGPNVHDASIRVPLILSGPGIAPGRVDQGSAGLIDVAPTLLELLLPSEDLDDLDGTSLADRLEPSHTPNRTERRPLFAESGTSFCGNSAGTVGSGRMEGRACVVDEQFTLCRNGDLPPELFNHHADPRQAVNLFGTLPQVEERLQAAFERWPPETARERALRLPTMKLTQKPLFGGGYSSHFELLDLYDGPTDPDTIESLEQRLTALLDDFANQAGSIEQRPLDPQLLRDLEALGYLR